MNDFVAQIPEEKIIDRPAMTKDDHADGIYFRMPEEEYHADTAMGASGICDLLQSPLKFYENSAFNKNRNREEFDEKETAAITRGNYFHDLISGQKNKIVVKPKDMSFAKTDGKAFKAKYPEDTIWIKADDATKVGKMIDAMRETGVLDRIGGMRGGINEVSFFWTDKAGRRRKLKIDRLFEGQAYDWKTMANSMSKDTETLVAHTVAQMKYHVKAYWYQVGLQAMKAAIKAKGQEAFKSQMREEDFAEMLALAETDQIVPFWYVFIEASGIANITPRRFVSHDASGNLNAYFRAAKQETNRALDMFDGYMKTHGRDKPWHQPAVWKDFDDQDFSAARWILAEE